MTKAAKPGDETPPTGIATSAVWQFIALAAIVLAAYWPSFSVPFYLDDFHNIVEAVGSLNRIIFNTLQPKKTLLADSNQPLENSAASDDSQ